MFHLPINPSSGLGHAAAFIGRHSPVILMTAAAGGVIFSVVKAVQATPKAVILLEEKKREIAAKENLEVEEVELTVKEKIQTCWKLYLAPAISVVLSIVCMFASLRISTMRNVALAGLYSSSQEALRRYEDKVIESVGKKENENIKNEVRKQKLVDHPVPDNMIPGEDQYLCYDEYSDRYWMGNLNAIKTAANEINEMLPHCMYVSLNEFYEKIGLRPNGVGREVGWTAEEPLELDHTPHTASNGYPCMEIIYSLSPHYKQEARYSCM